MAEHFMQHGVFSWNELMTTDLNAAKAFYTKLFGWTFEESEMEGGGTYAMAKLGETMVGGLFAKPATMPGDIPPHWGAYVTVDDVDKAAEQAVELGATIIYPLTDIPKVGRFCAIMDPQGAVIQMITYVKDLCCK